MRRRMGRRGLALAVAAVTVAAIGGTALAAFPQDTVKLYTGCLNGGGNITSVAEGDSPLQPCSSPKQIVKLSGGDITSLSVSAPLTGGGTNGAVSIGLSASATLPSCSSTDQVPKWNNTTRRWTCGADNDTKYSAGTGLDLTGTTFSVESDAFAKKGQACSSGFATGVDSSGGLTCAPASSKPAIWIKTDSYADVPDLAVPGAFTTILELSVPVGSYLATATAQAHNDTTDDDGEVRILCLLGGTFASARSNDGDIQTIGASSVMTRTSPGKITFECSSDGGSDHLEYVTLTALEVGTVTTQ